MSKVYQLIDIGSDYQSHTIGIYSNLARASEAYYKVMDIKIWALSILEHELDTCNHNEVEPLSPDQIIDL